MKKFTKNNQGFTCISCGFEVPPHPTSSRDHCSNCLVGLHVDINPGDRANECRGILRPNGMKIANGKTQILYKCEKCNKTSACIKAPDDNLEKLIEIGNTVR